MSNPDEVPRKQQPGSGQPLDYTQPPQPGSLPPAGYGQPQGYVPPQGFSRPPAGYQPPQGYPAAGSQPPGSPAPGYPAQGSQAQGSPAPGYRAPGKARAFRFELPADRPRNMYEVMPRDGFSSMFTVTGMPTELKISYWIWLIGGLLGLLVGVIGLFGSFVLLAVVPGLGVLALLLVLVALALAAAQVILSMKMKEGHEWARFALTAVAGISLVLAILNASAADGRGGGSWQGFLVSLVAVVLMWMPKSQAWFASLRSCS